MKSTIIGIFAIILLACNNTPETKPVENTVVADTLSYFPVTSYLKGQLLEIKEKGITPIKHTTIGTKTDSVAVKFEDLDNEVYDFLTPEIDSINLIAFYTETKFLDKSIDAFTFTYTLKKAAPDSLTLTNWDVYVNPESGKVKRVYLTKKNGTNKILQLTWLSGEWCSKKYISSKADGTFEVEKEEKIYWGK